MAIGNQIAVIVLELSDSNEVELSPSERTLLETAACGETSSDTAIDEVRNFLIRRQDVVKQAGVAIVERAFEFLDEELDHFQEIKKQRPLTDEELEYGRTVLPQLVQSVVKLCTRPKSGNSSGVPDSTAGSDAIQP